MRTVSTVITSTAMLVALAAPAMAAASASYMPRESDRTIVYTYNPYAAHEPQMPTSASAPNAHVYHGGPKLNN